MGTNYYIEGDDCKYCGHESPKKHIGKSSSGWCFALRIYPDESINDLDDWMPLLENSNIVNEYGDQISIEDMLSVIKDRCRAELGLPNQFSPSEEEFHIKNYSERGPNNLLRSNIGNRLCVKHGAGTWDCFDYEFS